MSPHRWLRGVHSVGACSRICVYPFAGEQGSVAGLRPSRQRVLEPCRGGGVRARLEAEDAQRRLSAVETRS